MNLPPSLSPKKWDSNVIDAFYWIKTNCRHHAVPGKDYQTVENLTPNELADAREYLELLASVGLLHKVDNNYRRFIVLPL